MKSVTVRIYALMLMATVGEFAGTHISEETRIRFKGNSSAVDLGSAFPEPGSRFKRQTTTPTTTTTTTSSRPKKNRPANIFSFISVLISETKEDTNRAVNEIGTLLNSQFSDSNGMGSKETTATVTETPAAAPSNGDEDNEVVTTTEASVSRSELLGALRSNVQGLVRLFGKEFRLAIKDSNQNVKEFGRDLGTALRPYFN